MVWGNKAASGVDDLAKRLQANDPLLRSLTILRFRRLNDGVSFCRFLRGLPSGSQCVLPAAADAYAGCLTVQDIAQLSTATQDNLVLQELICCSHAISTKAAAMLGRMLQQNRCLKHISIGNSTLGDEVWQWSMAINFLACDYVTAMSCVCIQTQFKRARVRLRDRHAAAVFACCQQHTAIVWWTT